VPVFVSGCPFLDTLLDICGFDFDGQEPPVGKKLHRELLHLPLSSSFRHRELKVGREYRVKVFNGFINA